MYFPLRTATHWYVRVPLNVQITWRHVLDHAKLPPRYAHNPAVVSVMSAEET